ncbi:general substrate transporter [Suillus fuscotomentosus]|uniref:General substrate transporter n=1 Tax=Suillus fuscotomentosus TaxID=1912939 RepID=A0AAD4EF91_9AGAM|nr:general substrate transporter [Suillus fuscotomentosus]KAG1905045.1 general substrate transporter [Suillus fuscotomentosus]
MPVPQWTITDFTYRESWWKNRGTSFVKRIQINNVLDYPAILILNICLILPLLSSTLNGFDSSMMNNLQILPGWQEYFHKPHGMKLGLINSAHSIGILSGTPFSPYVSDLLGRRAAMFIGAAIMLAGVLTQASCTTIQVFLGARVLIGLGMAFSINAAPLLISELSYPTHRGKLTSLYNSLWYSGSVISAWICLGSYDESGTSAWSWRVPSFVQAAIPIIQMSLIWLIPESPRFLMAKGLVSIHEDTFRQLDHTTFIVYFQESQAARVLAQCHANGGDERNPLVAFELAQIRHALNLEREYASGKSYLRCFSTPGNRQRMFTIIWIAVFSQWSGNGLVSYYFNTVLDKVGITQTRTKAAINGGLQIFNLASALVGVMIVDKVGRRKTFLISNIGMLTAFAMWTVTTALFCESGDVAAARATVPLIFIYFFFYDLAYTSMLVLYTLEILPYNIRAKGFAIMNIVLYSTNAFNSLVNPVALETIGWKYYLFYCGWLILELLFAMVYIIDTRARTLEETAALFDGVKVRRGIMERTGETAMNLPPYPRLQDSPEAGQTWRSSASPSHFEAQTGESVVGFAR